MDLVGCPQVCLDCGTHPSPAWGSSLPGLTQRKDAEGIMGGRVACVSTEITLGLYLRTV